MEPLQGSVAEYGASCLTVNRCRAEFKAGGGDRQQAEGCGSQISRDVREQRPGSGAEPVGYKIEVVRDCGVNGGIDDDVAVWEQLAEPAGHSFWDADYVKVLGDRSEPLGELMSLVPSDIAFGVVLADKQPTVHLPWIAEDEPRCASSSDELSDPRAEATASPHLNGLAGEP